LDNTKLKKEINDRACRFRTAIDKCDKNKLSDNLKKFPIGSCSAASYLLAQFLKNEFGTFDLLHSERHVPKFQTHAWLQKDNLIIDITADQFDGQNQTVSVVSSSEWHNTFKVRDCKHDPALPSYLQDSYNEILKHISND
jgi:hypothetical protein